MDNEKKNKLPIPTNIPKVKDFITGIGKKEIGIIVVVFILSTIFAVIIMLRGVNVVVAVGEVSFFVAITIGLIRRGSFNESFIDKLKLFKMYSKSQKIYEYEYHNIYEGEQNEKKY